MRNTSLWSEFLSNAIFTNLNETEAIQELVDDGKLPYVTQGVEYYEIVRKFVAGWLAKAGEAASDLPDLRFDKVHPRRSNAPSQEPFGFGALHLLSLHGEGSVGI